MWSEKVSSRQLWTWAAVALTGPLAQFAGSCSWDWVAVLGIGCGAICWMLHRLAHGVDRWPKWLCAAEFLWAAFMAGMAASWSGYCWDASSARPVVPLTLILLASCASWGGAERGSRVSCVLSWFLTLLYAVILAAGCRDLKANWMKPGWEGSLILIPIFLTPAVAIYLPRKKGMGAAASLGVISAFAVAISLWSVGALSMDVAAQAQPAFYEFSKSLSLFGVAERFESFVSVAMTMGYFSLFSMLISAAGHLAEHIRQGWGKGGVVAAAVTAGGVCVFLRKVQTAGIATGCLFLWIAVPLLYLALGRLSKSKKIEKRP